MALPTLKRLIGNDAETRARKKLEADGFNIVAQNFYSRFGEIDIIAQRDNDLVFVEVRVRKNAAHGSALESVSAAKQKKIIRTAQFYILNHPQVQQLNFRFDVIGFTNEQCEWIQGAFYAE